MSSDPFDLLGLDRKTATDADVRRAYAERLKVTRPEDDRAGFMALREAFERARESVRWREQYGDDDPYEDYEEDDDEDNDEDHDTVTEAESPVAQLGGTAVEDEPELVFSEEDSRLSVAQAEAEPERDPLEDAMTALIRALTDNPFGVSVSALMRIIEADEISGIDEFQRMQMRVRAFLCDRTGFNLNPAEIRQPEWLTLSVFDALDTYYGWTRQPSITEPWVRRQNDWLARVRKDIGLSALPKDERKKAELSRALEDLGHGGGETRPNGSNGGGLRWLFIGIGVIVYGIIQFVIRTGGG